jgi:hypothetical protein
MLKVEIDRKKTKSTKSRQLYKKKIKKTLWAQFPKNLILKDVIDKKKGLNCWMVKLKKKLVKKDLKDEPSQLGLTYQTCDSSHEIEITS